MLKLWCKLATKHWHCNICTGVVTMSIMISNTAISLPCYSWERHFQSQHKEDLTAFYFVCIFYSSLLAKQKEVYSDHEKAQWLRALPPNLWPEFHHQNPRSESRELIPTNFPLTSIHMPCHGILAWKQMCIHACKQTHVLAHEHACKHSHACVYPQRGKWINK